MHVKTADLVGVGAEEATGPGVDEAVGLEEAAGAEEAVGVGSEAEAEAGVAATLHQRMAAFPANLHSIRPL